MYRLWKHTRRYQSQIRALHTTASNISKFDAEVDVIVVGSGIAGLSSVLSYITTITIDV